MGDSVGRLLNPSAVIYQTGEDTKNKKKTQHTKGRQKEWLPWLPNTLRALRRTHVYSQIIMNGKYNTILECE